MAIEKHIVAVFTISESVPEFIDDANAFKQSITSAPGNTYVTIPPADITQFDTDMAALVLAQATAGSGEEGTAAVRDLALKPVVIWVRKWVRTVQDEADDAVDEATSIAIIQSCGLQVKKGRVFIKPDFEVKNDKGVSGLVHLISAAAPATSAAAYEWQMSANAATFTQIKITTESRTTYQTTVLPGTKVHFRKRVILPEAKGGMQAWSQSVFVIVT